MDFHSLWFLSLGKPFSFIKESPRASCRSKFKPISGKQVCLERNSVADPDPYVFAPPGSGSISQRYGSGSFCHQARIVRITLIPTVLWLLYDFLLKMMEMYLQKVISKITYVAVSKFTYENILIRSRIRSSEVRTVLRIRKMSQIRNTAENLATVRLALTEASPHSLLASYRPYVATSKPYLATPKPYLATPTPYLATPKLYLATPKTYLATPKTYLATPHPYLATPHPYQLRLTHNLSTSHPWQKVSSRVSVHKIKIWSEDLDVKKETACLTSWIVPYFSSHLRSTACSTGQSFAPHRQVPAVRLLYLVPRSSQIK